MKVLNIGLTRWYPLGILSKYNPTVKRSSEAEYVLTEHSFQFIL